MWAIVEAVKRVGLYRYLPTHALVHCTCGKSVVTELADNKTRAYRLHVSCSSCSNKEIFLVETFRSKFSLGIPIKIWRFQNVWVDTIKIRDMIFRYSNKVF